jgi:hypothetical protein
VKGNPQQRVVLDLVLFPQTKNPGGDNNDNNVYDNDGDSSKKHEGSLLVHDAHGCVNVSLSRECVCVCECVYR